MLAIRMKMRKYRHDTEPIVLNVVPDDMLVKVDGKGRVRDPQSTPKSWAESGSKRVFHDEFLLRGWGWTTSSSAGRRSIGSW